jgi:N-acyl-D-aspartate/D-glutamate deacylase
MPDLVGPLMNDPYCDCRRLGRRRATPSSSTAARYTTDLLTWLVRDTKKMTLEEAHYHLSYLPAQAAGFFDRGFLREGAPADIVGVRPRRAEAHAEWEIRNPARYAGGRSGAWCSAPKGYRWTIVNGTDHVRGRHLHWCDARAGSCANGQINTRVFANAAE